MHQTKYHRAFARSQWKKSFNGDFKYRKMNGKKFRVFSGRCEN